MNENNNIGYIVDKDYIKDKYIIREINRIIYSNNDLTDLKNLIFNMTYDENVMDSIILDIDYSFSIKYIFKVSINSYDFMPVKLMVKNLLKQFLIEKSSATLNNIQMELSYMSRKEYIEKLSSDKFDIFDFYTVGDTIQFTL